MEIVLGIIMWAIIGHLLYMWGATEADPNMLLKELYPCWEAVVFATAFGPLVLLFFDFKK